VDAWLQVAITIVGSGFAAYLAVSVKLTRLEGRVTALEDKVEDNDKRLWNQIGNDSFSGMRKIVHSVEGVPKAIMGLDRRVERLERHEEGNR
jgi:hypothetical protein